MIIALTNADRHHFSTYFNCMHRIRAEVFYHRLHWEVRNENGFEYDQFDELDPVYLLSIDEKTDRVRGSVRLLKTTSPHMLRNIFPQLVADHYPIESPTIWECSRFSIDKGYDKPTAGHMINYATGELIAGIVEAGLIIGLTHVVGVFDARMIRIFRYAQYQPEIIGKPTRIGSFMTYGGLFDISEQALCNIKKSVNIHGPVLSSGQVIKPLAA